MAEGSRSAEGPTTVTIFGRTYHLRGAGDPAYLTELASTVDGKMREIAEATGTADSMKLAILAALNLADARIRVESGDEAVPRTVEKRIRRLVRSLDEALAADSGLEKDDK